MGMDVLKYSSPNLKITKTNLILKRKNQMYVI